MTTTNNKSLKTAKIIYWILTSLVVLFESVMTLVFINSPEAIKGTQHLGFPEYFRMELSIGKVIGGIILIIPMIPARLKEWAYVGFGISCISAIIAEWCVDGPKMAIGPIIGLVIISIAYAYFHKVRRLTGKEL